MSATHDFFSTLPSTITSGLLDGQASVEIVDASPRIVPIGYTPEYLIVRAARCSFGLGLKDPVTDAGLIKYMFRNSHTSPFEMVNVTLRLVIPKFVAIQFLRHRTAHINEFSQRYAEVPQGDTFYDPLKYKHGIRLQSKTNKQGSVLASENDQVVIRGLMAESNVHLKALHDLYHKMIEAGCSNEVARSVLPISEYTTMYYQMDLNNLAKFLSLRVDFDHAQHETAVIATAILDLVRPLFPITIACLEDRNGGLSLSATELEIVKSGLVPDGLKGSAKAELSKKLERLLEAGVMVEREECV